jgi:hypothetical protein
MSATYCQSCCMTTHPDMLTGYCLADSRCDRCGRTGDLAIVVCGERTLSPDDVIRPCILAPQHEGYHDTGRP